MSLNFFTISGTINGKLSMVKLSVAQLSAYFWLRCLIFTFSESSLAELISRGMQLVELAYEPNCRLRSHIIIKINRVSSTPLLSSEKQLSLQKFKSKNKYLLILIFVSHLFL